VLLIIEESLLIVEFLDLRMLDCCWTEGGGGAAASKDDLGTGVDCGLFYIISHTLIQILL